jgi:protein RecA
MATTKTARTRAKVAAPAKPARTRVSVAAEGEAPSSHSTSYFANSTERTGLEFISTGCALLDQVMGGGYVLGRMSNIIGDKSTGKTLLAIEAVVNFLRRYSDGYVRYSEAESAFDQKYAAAMGMPVDKVSWAVLETDDGAADRTVEWLSDDISRTIKQLEGRPGLYILDSLDALSDRAELKRDIDDSSYGAQKAKKLGEMFRRLVGEIEQSRLCLIIISQIRDKIGVTFGETKMRAGGRAMDFYATHCLWLAQVGSIKKTVNKIDRTVGIDIRAKCKKNKVGLPFRECDFPLLFGYGVDDVTASAEWLIEVGKEELLQAVGMSKSGYKVRITALRNRGGPEIVEVRKTLDAIVMEQWGLVESTFLPQAGKY